MTSKEKVVTSFLLCPRIKAELREIAQREDRSLARTIERGLKEWLESRKNKQEDELKELTFY
jgi:predicted transcriptional regulator